MSVLDNFEQWKDFLANRLHQAKQGGMSEETVSQVAFEIGDYLAKQVDPKNNEERLLKELWDRSNEQEQQVLANLMVRLVQEEGSR